jgi:hypothetical protein
VRTRTVVTCLIALLAWPAAAQSPAPAPESPALQKDVGEVARLAGRPTAAWHTGPDTRMADPPIAGRDVRPGRV